MKINKNTVLRQHHIDLARENGACEGWLDWAVENVNNANVSDGGYGALLWAVRHCNVIISARLADRCAKEFPCSVLITIPQLLTKKRLDECATHWPRGALVYAYKYLTPAGIAWCKKQCETN